MNGLIQRVRFARVVVKNITVGEIKSGILLFIGIKKDDDFTTADKLLQKVLNFRIFGDDNERMNLSLVDSKGGLLIVSQFTLVAQTNEGLRPGFSAGASHEHGENIYNYFVEQAKTKYCNIATGLFGEKMEVTLLNDGPVTFLLEVK